ncbi:MAG TPA: hypothetical protein VG756_06775 [Pseudonocardiaceae bacterium]|jgi:hypothetical protein|nr:hypothetical protein [Pseudonocardiaceae bacterium]
MGIGRTSLAAQVCQRVRVLRRATDSDQANAMVFRNAARVQRDGAPDGTGGRLRHFIRYYRRPEIVELMTGAGLRPIATFGARVGRVTGEPFDEDESEAMAIIAVPSR